MPTTLYALEAFNGATGLYEDPARRRFVMTVFRPLAEGEVVEGATFGQRYAVTWDRPEAAAKREAA